MGGGGGVRGVAGTYLVLGLAVSFFALYAIALDPATFRELQLQMMKEASGHQLAEQGHVHCAATAAEAMEMRAEAVVLLLLGAGQTVMAMAAVVGTSRLRGFLAVLVSIPMALRLTIVFAGVVHVAIGRCHDQDMYHQVLVVGYVGVTVPFGMLLVAGLQVVLCA